MAGARSHKSISLLEAVKEGRLEDIRERLEAGEDVNDDSLVTGRTPLHVAASMSKAAVQLLLTFSPDIKVRNGMLILLCICHRLTTLLILLTFFMPKCLCNSNFALNGFFIYFERKIVILLHIDLLSCSKLISFRKLTCLGTARFIGLPGATSPGVRKSRTF